MDDRAEALRRRLYAPGATEEDRRQYAEVAPEPQQQQEPERPARHRPRLPIALLVVVAVVVAGGGAALTGRIAESGAHQAAASPVPTITPTLIGRPEQVPVSIGGVAAVAQRLRGRGSALAPIDTTTASYGGGTIVVLLSSSSSEPMGWEALQLVTRRDWSSYRKVVGRSPLIDRRGVPTSVAVHYTGDPPLWIQVEAPADSVWTLTVALTSGSGSALH